VLLVGAGLLLQTLQAVRHANPGFDTDRILTTSIDLFTAGYDAGRAKNFQNDLMDRLKTRPGIESVALSRSTPFSYRSYSSAPIAVEGYDAPQDQQPTAEYNEISPAFLATMGIPLISGREFTDADDETSLPVAIVDQTIASQFFRGNDPVGQRIQVKGQWLQIVGLSRTARYRNLLETSRPFLYVPLRQSFSLTVAMHVRTSQGAGVVAPMLVREIKALDSNVAPGEVITMREQVERTTAPQRIGMTILVVFATLALGLAAIGLYGVMAATVAQTSRELALRIALGANAADLLRLVLSRSLLLTAAGIGVGFAIALQVTRLLGYLLYSVSPRDPLAFGFAVAVIALASLVASLVPAWRATRTDPLLALRG
jgi:predicted permease